MDKVNAMEWDRPQGQPTKEEYAQHIRLTKKELQQYAKRLERTKNIEPRHLKIKPE
ncbi:MAG: hypothetical protein LBC20_15815 [Planctomycetaceae bacterium]|nr:hypothetical protein [Planctomycetaceae bacterium]